MSTHATGMMIGTVAAAASVKRSTIRYYEHLGLLPKSLRTPSGYRMFPPMAVKRLTMIRAARQFGFSLGDLASFFKVRDEGGKPCATVRDAAQRLLGALEADIATLQARCRTVRRTLRQWDRLLARTPGDRRAHLLETLRAPNGD